MVTQLARRCGQEGQCSTCTRPHTPVTVVNRLIPTEVSISGRIKSFLTDLLVQLAVLSFCVNSSRLYFFTYEKTSDLCDYHLKYLIFAWRKATKGICMSELWHLTKRPEFDGKTWLSAKDQVAATWLAHGSATFI